MYSLKEGPQFGGQEGAQPFCVWGICAHAKLHSEGAGSFQMFDRESREKMQIANRDAFGESQVLFQLWSSLVVSSPAFFGNLSCVFGEPAIVRPCSTLGFFWTSSRDDFWCFLVSGADFRGFGAPAMLLFRTVHRQVHTFVPVGATRRPTREQMGSPSRFFPPLRGRFSDHFLVLFRFFRNFASL